MRLFQSKLFILLSLAAFALTATACNDDDPLPSDEVDCDKTPDHEKCQTEVDCEETPDHEECQTDVDCKETPDHEECQTAGDCDAAALETAVFEQLNIFDTPAEDIPETVEVEEISELPVEGEENGQRVSNYRVLTFTLPSSGQPGSEVPEGSKLYLDIDNNEFLSISDEDALTNTEWDIAFDGKQLNYVYANSGHSGGYLGAWPAGLMLAELEDSATELEFAAIDATNTEAIPFAIEQWIDKDTCEADLTNWLPVLQSEKVLPQTTIGAWYSYNFDDHVMVANPTSYAIYNSANRHHVYKIKFLSYDATTLEVKLAVQDQFQQNACNAEVDAVVDAVGVSTTAIAEEDLPVVTSTPMPDAIIPGEGEEDDEAFPYRKLSFTLPANAVANASKLYLSIQNDEFVSISDEEALGLLEDDEGNPIRNEDWDIAIDLNDDNHVYVRSGQSGAYPHMDKYVSGWNPRGMMAMRKDDILDENAFTQWNSGADARYFGIEDFIDVDSAECALDSNADGQPSTIIGGDLFDVDNGAAFGIYTTGPCHNVFQFKVLEYNEATGDVELGVILSNPGVPAPGCQ